MRNTEGKKNCILNKIADHLLANGLQEASLRPMAAAADTSDRMLLHYFINKEELLTATLMLITNRLLLLLNSSGTQQMPFHLLLPHLAVMIKDPQIQPFLRLWLQLTASAATGEEYCKSIAKKMGDHFFDWILAVIKVERETDRKPLAALAFATIEGLVLLDALGSDELIASALEGLTLR